MLPNYAGGSLVNLIASVVAGCGAPPRHAPLDALAPQAVAQARNVVLFIIDGLGERYLARRGAGGELARRRRAAITSVFPSTTASAITTSYTGYTPLEHGLTGWYCYFGVAGCVAATLPFRSRGDNLSLAARGVDPRRLYSAPPLVDELTARALIVSPRSIIDSEYNRHHCGRAARLAYDTLDECIAQTEAAVKSGAERKYVY